MLEGLSEWVWVWVTLCVLSVNGRYFRELKAVRGIRVYKKFVLSGSRECVSVSCFEKV